jgi:hypothetical protein
VVQKQTRGAGRTIRRSLIFVTVGLAVLCRLEAGIRIIEPQDRDILYGLTTILVEADEESGVEQVLFYIDDFPQPICRATTRPFECVFDAGTDFKPRHIRVRARDALDLPVDVQSIRTVAFPRSASEIRHTSSLPSLLHKLAAEEPPAARSEDLDAAHTRIASLLLHGDSEEQRTGVSAVEDLETIDPLLLTGLRPVLRTYQKMEPPAELLARVERLDLPSVDTPEPIVRQSVEKPRTMIVVRQPGSRPPGEVDAPVVSPDPEPYSDWVPGFEPATAELIDADFVTATGTGTRARGEPGADLPLLDLFLKKMARVGKAYLHGALSFTADEQIKVLASNYTTGDLGRYEAPRSVYCFYDTGQGQLDDRRIEKRLMSKLQKRLARSEDVSDDLLNAPDPIREDTRIPTFVSRPYTWIFLFSPEAQSHYRYRIEGEEKRGVWISFRPDVADPAPEDWYGRVLVDRETYQILIAEGRQHRDVVRLRRARFMLESSNELPLDPEQRTFVAMTVRTEFNHLAHGIRFPSKVETKVYHHIIAESERKYRKKRLAYEVTQKYRNYRFYGVRVAETLAAIVN